MNLIAVAKMGYQAYLLQMSLHEVGTPEPPALPEWEELTSREQLSWINAATAICDVQARAVLA
jgi:hypothetical protein